MNKIVIYFTPCSPAPSGGYEVLYRVAGTTDAFISAGHFFVSPAVFYDSVNPAGTCYEGYIRTDCGEILGNHVLWESCVSGDPPDRHSCDTSIAINTADLNYVDLGYFDIFVDEVITVDLVWASYDRPNKFTLYENDLPIDTTGWVGYAPYGGPWGASLSTFENGTMTFNPLPGRTYKIRIEAGNAGPSAPYNISDNFQLDIKCR